MHTSFLLCALIASAPLAAQVDAAAPTVLPPDSPRLHLAVASPPIYPPIARAAHVAGPVTIHVVIGPDGHIRSAKVLSGPDMLEGSALDSLRRRLYAPVIENGKPVSVSTDVTIIFDLKAPASQYGQPSAADMQDRKLDWRLRTLEEDCTSSIASNSSPSKQVALCKKAADLADQFSEEGFVQRRRTFDYLSTALRRNDQLPDALDYANRAIAAAEYGFEDGAAASTAYSTRAEVEVKLGNLAKASEDLTIAEDRERNSITRALAPSANKNFDVMRRAYVKSNFSPVLKGLLLLHTQILTALDEPAEAAAKKAEAETL